MPLIVLLFGGWIQLQNRKNLDILDQGKIKPLKDKVAEVFEQIERSMSEILKKPEYAKAVRIGKVAKNLFLMKPKLI